jgi:large repetitive protein
MRQAGTVRGAMILVGAAMLLAATAGSALGFGTFRSPDPYPTGGYVYGLDIGDVTRDGTPDILAGNAEDLDDHISLLRGTGGGGFEDEMRIEDPNNPEGIAIGRFDSDRKPDFAVANYDSGEDNKVSIYLGAGGGEFDPGQVLDGVSGSWLLQSADLDRDGRLDLIAGNYDAIAGEAVSVFLGTGSQGEFLPADTYQVGSGGAYGLAVARMNGDKRPDVVVVTEDNGVSVLLANADGSLGTGDTVEDATMERGFDGVAVADFDGDGRNDAIVTDYQADELHLLRGKGDGTLKAPDPVGPDSLADTGPYPIEARDLTGDGRPDLAVGAYNAPVGLLVLENRKGKRFRLIDQHALGDYPEFIAAGRLNEDKGADVVVGTDSGVEVLRNKRKP